MSRLIPENQYTSTGWHSRQKLRGRGGRVQKFNFDELDKERSEAIHFEIAIRALAKVNNRRFDEIAILLVRAIESFKWQHPTNGLEFRIYNYYPALGFNFDLGFQKISTSFLRDIAKGLDYYEDPNPDSDGQYWLEKEGGNSWGYSAFYFKLTELLCFLMENNLPIPDDFAHALPDARKRYDWYKKLIRKDIDRFLAEQEEREGKSKADEQVTTQWSEFAGKDTALMLISGMAIALEQSGGRYARGGKINKSAVAEAARKAINEYGKGTEITTKALTDLLKAALEQNITKLEP
ncbi:Uncharacterised protein [Serratia ficaria]|uniref:hypothetical protein n=1 Tax=Serratia ficaria TaxID=61651 RepID=UPI00217A7B7B|nr:hypothetical protein [Serratia ficaria]CAI1605666.1 Uncharacterised protein [Serratia ficaria]